ncbi:heat-inducible transcriptional repressor HrcA [Microbacterium indicum]|uniref:heat-inducible transcriptional repressor HrcA n=1 Tax=Microbacterium indicum TaxID=358100 RepID=UPI0003FAFF70|nr:heat-inducible transcriptional repressor HrcA [Microbacterium indicum]
MVTERGLRVLQAIVQDYVDTHEPVGSKAIVDRHSFGVSAATIRNDMALLEDEELIAQPHTSSGRVPTDKGYRAFVDHLADLRPLSGAQRSAIATFLADPADLDDLLGRTVRLLTQLTGQVALVQYPSFARAVITHVQFVPLDARRVLAIIVTDTGRVSQRITAVPEPIDETDLEAVRLRLLPLLIGKPVGGAAELLAAAGAAAADPLTATERATREIAGAIAEELEEFRQNRLVMAGTATLARREDDFRGSIHPLLEAIEEQVTLLQLMSEMAADDNRLATSIGRENAAFGLSEASFVASEYDAAVGTARMGLMGPTRMDYARNLSAARAVARYLTRMLDEDENR